MEVKIKGWSSQGYFSRPVGGSHVLVSQHGHPVFVHRQEFFGGHSQTVLGLAPVTLFDPSSFERPHFQIHLDPGVLGNKDFKR